MRKEASLNIVSKQQSQSQSQSQIENNKRGNEGLILFLRKLDVPQHNQRLSFTIRKAIKQIEQHEETIKSGAYAKEKIKGVGSFIEKKIDLYFQQQKKGKKSPENNENNENSENQSNILLNQTKNDQQSQKIIKNSNLVVGSEINSPILRKPNKFTLPWGLLLFFFLLKEKEGKEEMEITEIKRRMGEEFKDLIKTDIQSKSNNLITKTFTNLIEKKYFKLNNLNYYSLTAKGEKLSHSLYHSSVSFLPSNLLLTSSLFLIDDKINNTNNNLNNNINNNTNNNLNNLNNLNNNLNNNLKLIM